MPILSAFGAAKALGAGGGSVVVPDYSYDFGGSAYISAPSSTPISVVRINFRHSGAACAGCGVWSSISAVGVVDLPVL